MLSVTLQTILTIVMKTKQKKKKNDYEDIYYNVKHPAGYGGAYKLKAATTHGNVMKWLSGQPPYTLHKPMLRKFPTRPYRTRGINDLWQMDLMEMIPYAKINNGYKYILTCIDVFSRFARALPLKSKGGLETAKAIATWLHEVKPIHIQTDQGKEFYNTHVQSLFKTYNINHYSVYSQFKAAIVERFNRTLRGKLNRYFTHTAKKIWIDVLDDMISSYNNSKHRGIFNMKPVDIDKSNEMKIWMRKNDKLVTVSRKPAKFKTGQYVRISRLASGPFIKNFDQNWSEEVFKVAHIDRMMMPIMYILEDWQNKSITGKFYRQELQLVDRPEIYRIEKVIRTKGVGKHKQLYVKWYGYGKEHSSWIQASQLHQNE